MQRVTQITSAANDRVKAVARLLREKRDRERSGLLVAEGMRQVTRAAAAGLRLLELWVCPQPLGARLPELHAALAAAQGATEALRFEITSPVLAKMAYRGDEAEGVLAIFQQPRWELDGLSAPQGLWLVAVGISKPGNLGAMARSAQAAGAAGMIVAEGVVDAFNPNAIWASTAAVFSLPIVAVDRPRLLAWLGQNRIRLFAAMPEGEKRHDEVDWRGCVALAVGAEDTGLAPHWLDDARATGGSGVRIDMASRSVDSLNASVAAGVLLFEAARQRR